MDRPGSHHATVDVLGKPRPSALRIAFVHPSLGLGGAERLVLDAALAVLASDVAQAKRMGTNAREHVLAKFSGAVFARELNTIVRGMTAG